MTVQPHQPEAVRAEIEKLSPEAKLALWILFAQEQSAVRSARAKAAAAIVSAAPAAPDPFGTISNNPERGHTPS
jgi:hypothetical protein